MTRMLKLSLITALLALPGTALPETPLARPLAEFDKLVAQLTSANVVVEPVRAGDATVVPFAAVNSAWAAPEPPWLSGAAWAAASSRSASSSCRGRSPPGADP